MNKKVDIILFEVVLWNVIVGLFLKCFGVEEGCVFEILIVEFYYKNDDLNDFFINDEYMKFLGIVNDEEIVYLKGEICCINEFLKDWFV